MNARHFGERRLRCRGSVTEQLIVGGGTKQVLALSLSSASKSMLRIGQSHLELTDDRAEAARCKQAWPEGSRLVFPHRRKLP